MYTHLASSHFFFFFFRFGTFGRLASRWKLWTFCAVGQWNAQFAHEMTFVDSLLWRGRLPNELRIISPEITNHLQHHTHTHRTWHESATRNSQTLIRITSPLTMPIPTQQPRSPDNRRPLSESRLHPTYGWFTTYSSTYSQFMETHFHRAAFALQLQFHQSTETAGNIWSLCAKSIALESTK